MKRFYSCHYLNLRALTANLLLWPSVITFQTTSVFADRVPEGIDQDVIQYICEAQTNGTFRPIGTCFTVGVRAAAPLKGHFRYVVTAKHVVQKPDGSFPTTLVLRANRSEGGSTYLFTPLNETNSILKIYTHSDPAIDLAVIPILRAEGLRLNFLGDEFIAAEESIKTLSIRQGDEMFFLGLFTPFPGANENIPIYRFGRLSMLTNEKIPWSPELPQNLYLMETQVFGGNSGAPVFFYFDERRNPGGTKILLAGVVKGFFRDWSEIKVVNTKLTPIAPENNGIAAVVPAHYLKDILYSEELKRFRMNFEKAATGNLDKQKANGPVRP